MLARKYRLTKNNDFLAVYRKGRLVTEGGLSLRFAKNNLDYPRVGFVVSRKVSVRATQRNLLKRRLREAMRGFLPSLSLGADLVITARREILAKDFWQIKELLESLLRKTRLLKKEL